MNHRFICVVASLIFLHGASLYAADAGRNPAADPSPRNDWMEKHNSFLQRAGRGNIDLLFLGDSITAGWGSAYLLWKEHYEPFKAANFGIGGDRTENVLWRIQNGEVEGYDPKVVVLLIGINNLSAKHTPSQIEEGIAAIVHEIRNRKPKSKILLLGIFPRGQKPGTPERQQIAEINRTISGLDDGEHVFFLDIGSKFLEPDETISKENMSDFLHPTHAGYKIWADAMQEKLTALLPQ